MTLTFRRSREYQYDTSDIFLILFHQYEYQNDAWYSAISEMASEIFSLNIFVIVSEQNARTIMVRQGDKTAVQTY